MHSGMLPWCRRIQVHTRTSCVPPALQVKYPILWRVGYTVTQPRLVHVPAQQIMGLMVGHFVSRAYAQYKPDLVVSVHPLMQVVCPSATHHVPKMCCSCPPAVTTGKQGTLTDFHSTHRACRCES